MTKATQNKKQENNHEGWKVLIQGFVSNILEKVSDNVSQRVHVWTKQMKRRAIGGIAMLLGATYFLTGLSDYISSLLGESFPGFGYIIIGALSVLIGYLVSRK